MDHNICVNKNSFPAENETEGKSLFDDALQGVLALNEGADRFHFYFDSGSSSFLQFEISPQFTVQSFIDQHDPDMATFLHEALDKSTALDCLTDEQIEECANAHFYMAGEADDYLDDYCLAVVLDAYLFSISTEERWTHSEISISVTDHRAGFTYTLYKLKHISTRAHGLHHVGTMNQVNISDLVVEPNLASESVVRWINEQSSENKKRIISKLELAIKRNFQGGKPLFDTLHNADGLREIRLDANGGGAIRILFKKCQQQGHILLYGFIKHSDGEGYDQAIQHALAIYAQLYGY